MACSCKARNKITAIDPLTKVEDEVDLQLAVRHEKDFEEQKQDQLGQQLQKLDVSSTTAPDQLCFNCVRKHLGLAYMLLKNGGQIRHLIAAGQLMCASNHLLDKYPNFSYKLLDTALFVLRTRQSVLCLPDITTLIQDFTEDPDSDLSVYIPLYSYSDQKQLLALVLIYSLLFVEITYQEVNKTWATAHLSYMAYIRFRDSLLVQNIYEYRALWKLIQSMQFYDDNYLLARQLLQKIILQKYGQVVQRLQQRVSAFEQQKQQRDLLLLQQLHSSDVQQK